MTARAAADLEIRTFTSSDFGQNGYVARGAGSERAVMIDPGGAAAEMIGTLETEGWTLDAVLLTHAHLDHITGVNAVVRATGAPVYLHAADRPLYDAAAEQAGTFGLRIDQLPPIDHEWEDEARYDLGGCSFAVRHVPGHSPGHVLLYAEAANVAFVGDVVFAGSIGRTDLPGGDYQQLMASIRERLLTLPDETELYPGHGPTTTVGHERVSNPFLVPHFGGGLA